MVRVRESKTAFHVVLGAVLQVREGRLQVLLWQRAREPFTSAPGPSPAALSNRTRSLEESIRRHLAAKVDVRELSHLEQLETRGDPDRNPRAWRARDRLPRPRPADIDPVVPADTGWHPVDALPPLAFDHEPIMLAARERLRAKLSYTNVGFALAPDDVHDLRAARVLRRRARSRRLADEPAPRPAPPRPPHRDRRSDGIPAEPAAGPPPSSASTTTSSRSPTSSPSCGRRTDRRCAANRRLRTNGAFLIRSGSVALVSSRRR